MTIQDNMNEQAETNAPGKTYDFNETHDRQRPAQHWFQDSSDGLTLFVVFYTQACRWSRCLGCNLPSKSSQFHVDYKDLIGQIDHVFGLPEVCARKDKIEKLIVSNNGSVLDEATFSSTALLYLMARINLNFSKLSVLTLETRPEFVDTEELEFLARALAEGDTATKLELAIGFEAFDETIRNDVFDKGMSLELFEHFIQKVAKYDYRVKCYFMQKPVPDFSDKAAVTDIQNGIDYLSSMAKRYQVEINMHLNPTYAAYGTPLEKSFNDGSFVPPQLTDVARAVFHAREKQLSIYVGLYDEGLAVEGGSFIRQGDKPLMQALAAFNRNQKYELLQNFV